MTNNHLIHFLCLLCLINNSLSLYYFLQFVLCCYSQSFNLFPRMVREASLSWTLFLAFQIGQGVIRNFSLVKGCIYTTPNNQAEREKIQSVSQMAPDAWHCVDGNSQMAEWIFPFPSGCVTWWRCSQSLEPKENASQGDEVLLLSRHLICAGWYCDLGFTYSFRSRSL